ncbi:MAG: hypothetical protein SGCHY_005381, partial [Lobulomycetales sp.]
MLSITEAIAGPGGIAYPNDEADSDIFAFANILEEIVLRPGQIVNYSAKLTIEEKTPLWSTFNAKPVNETCGEDPAKSLCMFGNFKANFSQKALGGTFAIVAPMNGKSSGESAIASLLCGAKSGATKDRVDWVVERACGMLTYFNSMRGEMVLGENSMIRFFQKPGKQT